jgi:hypothetical protein
MRSIDQSIDLEVCCRLFVLCFHSFCLMMNTIIIIYSLFFFLFDLTIEHMNICMGLFVTGPGVRAIANTRQ